MKTLFFIVSIVLCLVGASVAGAGYSQLFEGVPGFYLSRNIAELQSDANEILLGIGFLLSGIALILGGLTSAVLALAFGAQREIIVNRESEENKTIKSGEHSIITPQKDKLPETIESQSREVKIGEDGSITYRGETAKKVGQLYHYRGKSFMTQDRLIQEIDSMF